MVLRQNNHFPVLIPGNIDLDALLDSFPLTNVPNAKDYLLYILSLIKNQRRTWYEDGSEVKRYFTPIYSESLQLVIKNYSILLRWLVDRGILDVDNSYQIDGKPKSYRFTNEYCTELKQEYIIKRAFVRKLYKRIEDAIAEMIKVDESIKAMPQSQNSAPYHFELEPLWVLSGFIEKHLMIKRGKLIKGLKILGIVDEDKSNYLLNRHPHNLYYYEVAHRNGVFIYPLMIDYNALLDIKLIVERNPELFPRKGSR